jgi:hypothetical protein
MLKSFETTKKYLTVILLVMLAFTVKAQICPITSSASELITNGNFNAGNTGFTTSGTPFTYSAGSLGPGEYTIGTNPSTYNSTYYANITDHTTGSGNMLIIDGDGNTKDIYSTTVTTAANTTYYLSAWFANIETAPNKTTPCSTCPGGVSFVNSPVLVFLINGVQIGGTIHVDSIDNNWNQFYTSWNSGAGGSTTIEIRNIITTSNGNDLALDDISFNTSCSNLTNLSTIGVASSQPNTISLCTVPFPYTIDSGLGSQTGYTYLWKDKFGNPLPGTNNQATYTISSTPANGTKYYLCYSSPLNIGCPRIDSTIITNGLSVNLGPNVSLCNPASVTLATGVNSPPTTIVWTKNGTVISGQTSPNLFVNSAGTYAVQVSAPGCGTANSSVVVSNTVTTPTNTTFCSPPQSVTLSVSPVNSGKYKWWSDPTSTNPTYLVQNGGNTYTFTATTTSTYTFYAQDTSSFAGTVGPTTLFSSGGSSYTPMGTGSPMVAFTANQNFTILSMQIPINFSYLPSTGATVQVGIEIRNSTGTSFSTPLTFTSNVTTIPGGSANGLFTFTFPSLNVLSAWGPNLTMSLNSLSINGGGSGYAPFYNGITASYPYASVPAGVASISSEYWNGSGFTGNYTTQYSYFYNWQVQAGTPCARIPVQAVYNCAAPVTWLYANASNSDIGTVIKWATSKEVNNSYFIIESSSDGVTFTEVGRVNGQINSNTTSSYDYIDKSPSVGNMYYRIKQVDMNGDYSYSTLMSVSASANMLPLLIYPNPTSSGNTITIRLPYISADWTMKMYNVKGQIVYSGSSQGNQTEIISNMFAQGVYAVEATDGQHMYHAKLIIQ